MKKPSFFENGFHFTSFWRNMVCILGNSLSCFIFVIVPEQKARTTYDNLLRLIDDPDVREPLKFLREREVVHFQRFGDALRVVQDNLDAKNYYAYNPSIDIRPKEK